MTTNYITPKSSNMLSHLTNAQALADYKRENARKLVKKQEELLRNLSKVRSEMEQEESHIGKTKDYYSGSRKDKFGHTLGLADKRKQKRFADKEVDNIIKAASEEAKLPISQSCYSTADSFNVTYKPTGIYGESGSGAKLTGSYGVDTGYSKNQSEIRKLKDQVEGIANRYQTDTGENVKFTLYAPEYYPGACYVYNAPPLADTYVSGTDIAQYFPVTKYVLH